MVMPVPSSAVTREAEVLGQAGVASSVSQPALLAEAMVYLPVASVCRGYEGQVAGICRPSACQPGACHSEAHASTACRHLVCTKTPLPQAPSCLQPGHRCHALAPAWLLYQGAVTRLMHDPAGHSTQVMQQCVLTSVKVHCW